MKEQLEFSDMPWELRHCWNCDSCYWSLFTAKTFLKMSFLLKMMLLRKFSALVNVVPYCHAAPQSREEALMQCSQGGSGSDGDSIICPPQETSGTPKKAMVFSGDCCRLRKGELPLQALPVTTPIAAGESGHHSAAYAQKKTRASWGQSPLSQALDKVFGDCPLSPASTAWPGSWRRAAGWAGTQQGFLDSQGLLGVTVKS